MKKLEEFNKSGHDVIFACDTEVANIDPNKESPCGHGTVICFSIYSRKPSPLDHCEEEELCLWVDTMDQGTHPKGLVAIPSQLVYAALPIFVICEVAACPDTETVNQPFLGW